MNLIMIGVIKVGSIKGPISGIRILDIDVNKTMDITLQSIIDALTNGLEVINLTQQNGKLVGINGAVNRYPLIIDGIPYNKSPLIVLKIMNNGDYIVSDFKGEIVRMSEDDVIRYSETEGIANGKVVTKDGTRFISAISGEYERESPVDVAQNADRIQGRWDMLDVADYAFNDNNEFYVVNKESSRVRVPGGVIRIAANAFAGMVLLQTVKLPNKLEYIGEGAFSMCAALESIDIPNGIKVIPSRCFDGCKRLSDVTIAESVLEIESRAFLNCHKLKKIYIKNPNTRIKLGAIPAGCRKIIAR